MSTTDEATTTKTKVSLLELILRNFKGVKEYRFKPDGQNASILGDNATGKTTVADACWWLFGGKDSDGRSDFEIKRLTEDGTHEHKLDHEVEGAFMVGDEQKVLRKVYKEQWTKRRGQTEREFSGHTTDYFINGVPTTAGEFSAIVGEIATEEIMRLLTDPYQFSAGLHWEKRRELVLDVCGDVSDEDVIASNEDLADLPEILESRTQKQHKKMVNERRKAINDELDKLPVRIDEADRALPNISELLSVDECNSDMEKAKTAKSAAEQEKARIEAGGQVAEKTKELRELEASIQAATNTAQATQDRRKATIRTEMEGVAEQLSSARSDANEAAGIIERADNEMVRLSTLMDEKREEWKVIDAETFEHTEPDTCAACSRPLPVDQVEDAKQKATERFNVDKAARLNRISDDGKAAKRDHESLMGDTAARNSRLDDAKKQVTELETKHREISDSLANVHVDADFGDLAIKKAGVEQELERLNAGNTEAIDQVQERINDQDGLISRIQVSLDAYQTHERGQKRIEELKEREKTLAAEFEELERQLHLMDLFIKTKVTMLDEHINSRFKMARFKLFNELVNGGIEECCEVSYGGVPWSDLNHGSQINIGLDVISTLHDHFGVTLPVWVDQSESVTTLSDLDCQVIRLVVSPDDSSLRVELAE